MPHNLLRIRGVCVGEKDFTWVARRGWGGAEGRALSQAWLSAAIAPTLTQLSHTDWGEGNTSSLFLYVTATVYELPETGGGGTQDGAVGGNKVRVTLC
ncbi:hypothetical protein E2C01_096169 [Portunus trituberculatus]|uniref:Uncharacterized protein n=1 Tax=Portunus trituberculatus TaxID=210409 RepID=A0A5B7K144_PORTR|nr:hypothetical protein [Portunus trituberculatus]